MDKIKVRFNLSAGKNFMKWKVEYPNKAVMYYHPDEVKITMLGCQLKNHKATANKIHNGAHKTVCAWVLCDSLYLSSSAGGIPKNVVKQLKYNPRVLPHWADDDGNNLDNTKHQMIVSQGKNLFLISN